MLHSLPPWMGKSGRGALVLMGLAWLSLGAWAQPGAVGPLPNLPAVEDETASTSTPAAAPALVQGGRFASVEEARDKIREAFARGEFSAVLSLAREIRQQFPAQTFMRYYEAMARLRLQDSSIEPSKLPYRRLENLPVRQITQPTTASASVVSPNSAQLPASTPPTPAPAAQGPVNVAPALPAATPAPAATPVPRAVAPVPAEKKTLARLIETLRALPILYILGGFGLLGCVAVVAVILHRRRGADVDEEEENLEDILSAPAAARGMGRRDASGGMALDDENELSSRPAGTTGFFRSEVQALAASAPVFVAPPDVEFEDEVSIAPPPEAPPPSVEPIFALMTVDEPPAEAVPSPAPFVLAASVRQDVPPQSPDQEDLLVVGDEISFDDDLFEPDAAPEAERSESEARPLAEDESLKLDIEQTPPEQAVWRGDKVVESLMIEDQPRAEFQAPPQIASAESEPGNDGGITPSDEETLVGYATGSADEMTLDGSMDMEPAATQAAEDVEPEEFQAFRPGETVRIRMPAEDQPEENEDLSERTRISQGPPEEAKETMDALDSSADVFEREYRQGMKDIEARNWVGAIHHLSIAAALRPSTLEVKERLREVRRMRARELEGRG